MDVLKQTVEKYIQDNYSDTKIHFFGTDFDSKGLNSWVQVKFSPVNPIVEDSQSKCGEVEGLLEIYTYAKNTLTSLTMANQLQTLVRNQNTFFVGSSIPMEQSTFDNNIWFTNSRITVSQLRSY